MRTLHRLALLALLVFGATASAYSQNHTVIYSNIPFNFYAGSRLLPAGKYALDEQPGDHVVVIRNEDERGMAILQTDSTESNTPLDKSDLVFKKVGKDYFLSDLWVAGDTSGLHLPESKLEKKEERMGNVVHGQHTTVAAHPYGY